MNRRSFFAKVATSIAAIVGFKIAPKSQPIENNGNKALVDMTMWSGGMLYRKRVWLPSAISQWDTIEKDTKL